MNTKLPEGGKILVPVDGSQSSKEALSYAIDVAKKCSANITLVHVVPRVAIMVHIIKAHAQVARSRNNHSFS